MNPQSQTAPLTPAQLAWLDCKYGRFYHKAILLHRPEPPLLASGFPLGVQNSNQETDEATSMDGLTWDRVLETPGGKWQIQYMNGGKLCWENFPTKEEADKNLQEIRDAKEKTSH